MVKKNRLSRDQKRKAKLKKREDRIGRPSSMAYHGRKYKRDDLVEVFYFAEVGIHDADLLFKRNIVDADVFSAIEFLIEKLRLGPLPDETEFDELAGTPQSVVVSNIIESWHSLFERRPRPSRDELVGVLRTTLGSIETRGEMHLSPRGYLDYITRFLKEGAAY